MPMDSEIARSFLDWSIEEVSKWLSTLGLSQDYSEQFRAHQITGDILIKLNSAALDDLRITEGVDRLKILQQITTMRADLIIDSPARRGRSPAKPRRFSETLSRSAYSPVHRRAKAKYSTGVLEQRTLSPTKRGHTPISPKYLDGLVRGSPDSLSLESPISSGMSSPIKLRSRDVSPNDGVNVERRERELVNRLKANATLRGHNMKRLSRSLDGLFQEGEDIFSLSAKAEFQDACNSRLVDILREENAALKKDLETYYQRVRKLQKLEQEIEHIREGQRMLEASTSRREKLEGALRTKLEKQVRSLRGEIVHLKAELHRSKKQEGKGAEIVKNGETNSASRSRDIRRRDTMIMSLIKQNQESTAAREQLEKDLHTTRLQLQEKSKEDVPGDYSTSGFLTDRKITSETEKKMSKMYSQSIDKLKSVLSTMQNMSAKREKLEKHLRGQLLAEIRRLKGGSVEAGSNGRKETHGELLVKTATLEADLIKWEQRCLELIAEKQMALEAAVIPRDSRMEQLERTVSEQVITIQELNQQRSSYVSQLTDKNKSLAELETKVSSLKLTVAEKDAVIQALQNSLLDPEDLSQDDYALMGSPILHHSPVSAKKHSFSLTGAQVDVDGTVSLPGDIPSSYPLFPASPPVQRRGLPNGTYARGHVTDIPMRRYSDKGVPVGPLSLSPVKRTAVAGPPVYMMKDPPAYASGPPNPHYKMNYPPTVSNSAPNSPNNRTGSRKSRISHPNIHFLRIPSRSPPPSSPRKPVVENGKPNLTSPVDVRRNHSKPPFASNPAPAYRMGKSKTPPPNYKLVSFSSSSTSHQDSLMSSKQRHHSVDDVLKDPSPSIAPKRSKDSMELFNSLLGNSGPPQTQSEYKQALQLGGARDSRGIGPGHQHSKSSPSSERRNCYTVVN